MISMIITVLSKTNGDKIPQTTVDNVMQIMITSINKEFYSQ